MTSLTTLQRRPDRGSHDRTLIHAILDEGLVCHVGFSEGSQPFVIPTGYARDGDRIYLHGAHASRMMTTLARGVPCCVTVTLLDGLVLARAAKRHSMNYRSVVIFGSAHAIESRDEKRRALERIVEHVVPGRYAQVRAPSDAELDATRVVELSITEASAKTRTGPPVDSENDSQIQCWAGVIPLRLRKDAPVFEESRGEFCVSTDRARFEIDAIHRWLSREAYWSPGITREKIVRSVEQSLCFGVYGDAQQVGFARVITDHASFAYLCDVFIDERFRGRGLGHFLMQCIHRHPELQGLRGWFLKTRDAHGLYAKSGWRPLRMPDRFLSFTPEEPPCSSTR